MQDRLGRDIGGKQGTIETQDTHEPSVQARLVSDLGQELDLPYCHVVVR